MERKAYHFGKPKIGIIPLIDGFCTILSITVALEDSICVLFIPFLPVGYNVGKLVLSDDGIALKLTIGQDLIWCAREVQCNFCVNALNCFLRIGNCIQFFLRRIFLA